MYAARCVIPLLATGLLLGSSTRAAAQTRVAGLYRVSLGTQVLTYTSVTVDPEGGGADVDTTGFSFGLPTESISTRLTYATSDRLLVGGALTFVYDSTEQKVDDQSVDSSQSQLSLGPRLEYTFGSSGFEPFVSAELGFIRVASETEEGGATQDTTQSGFYVQGGLGLRYFLSPALSLEPEAALFWESLSGEREQGGASADFDTSVIGFGVGLAVSVWP
jgi:Outer membrane protein beta-barrel domain